MHQSELRDNAGKPILPVPPRPTVSEDMIREAATAFIEKHGWGSSSSYPTVADIMDCYMHPAGGWDLALELIRRAGCDLSRADMEELDEIELMVDALVKKAQEAWLAESMATPGGAQ